MTQSHPVQTISPLSSRNSQQSLLQAVRQRDETNKTLSSRLAQYAEVFSRLKARNEKAEAELVAAQAENKRLKAENKSLMDQNHSLRYEVQNLESQMQLCAAELLNSDTQLLDSDHMISGVFGIGESQEIKDEDLQIDLPQTLTSYSSSPIDMAIAAEAAAVPAEDGAAASETSGMSSDEFQIDLSEIERDLAAIDREDQAAA